MTKYILLWMALLLGQASAQTPFPFVPHQVLGADALNAAGGSKADATNGHLTTPVITGGTQAAPAITNPTILGNVAVSPTGSMAIVANVPLEGFYAAGGGSLIQMCPGYDFGCPSAGHVTAQVSNVTTSLGDAGVQESGYYAYLVNKTGQALPWANGTAYTQGIVTIGDSGQNLYFETVASCTSAASGGGPTGLGTGIVDGTCSWDYHGNPSLRGKIGIGSVTLVLPGGGDAWAGAFDTFIEPGWLETFATGFEIDITNNSGRDATGFGLTIPLLYLGGSVGTNPITAIIHASPFGTMGTNFMSHEGLWIQGQYTIKDHDIRMSTHSMVGVFDDGVHGTASYFDGSTSPNGILLEGNYSTGNAMVANATIAAFQTSPGADFTGFTVTNAGTTVNTTNANLILNTGNSQSYARFDLFDSNSLNFQTGSAVSGGITISSLAGPINLNPGTHLNIGGVAAVGCTAGTVNISTISVTDGIVTHC